MSEGLRRRPDTALHASAAPMALAAAGPAAAPGCRSAMTAVAILAAVLATGCANLANSQDKRQRIDAAALPTLAAPLNAYAQADLSIERWWTVFGDSSLNRLIEQALMRNHDLAAAAARVQAARAQLNESQGRTLPTLDLQASHGRARQSADAGLPPGTELIGSQHRVSLVSRYELDLWGRLASANEAARQQLLAQQWARAGIEWSLTAQLAEAHFSLRAVQRQLEISQALRDSRATTLSLRRREHAAGIGNEFDLRRAEAELAGTDATLASLQRQRTSLEATLALLSGRPLAAFSEAESARDALNTAQPFIARLPQGSAGDMLLRRPDVRQAEARLAAAQADIAAARAATLPAISLSGSVGSDVHSLSRLFDGPGMVWSLAAGLTQSIFDGGQRQARVNRSDALADEAFANYQKAVLGAVVDLREAYAALDIALAAQRAEQERVAALDRARRLALQGYTSGALGYLDLLDAERNAYQAQLGEVSTYRDRLLSQVAAFKALGGGYAAHSPFSGGHAVPQHAASQPLGGGLGVAQQSSATRPAAEELNKGYGGLQQFSSRYSASYSLATAQP